LQYELADVLSTPDGARLMKASRWIGRAAIPIAAIALVFDALLLPTPMSLLLLAFLWAFVAGPYISRSRRRKRNLFRRYPQHSLVDPDAAPRARIARAFFIIAMVVWSGVWQRAVIYICMPWLDAYADQLYDKTPMIAPLPTAMVWKGALPVTPVELDPLGLWFHVGFGMLRYSPVMEPYGGGGYIPLNGWAAFTDGTETRISPAWYILRPPWNFLGLSPRLFR
jgi:hypothetical protein